MTLCQNNIIRRVLDESLLAPGKSELQVGYQPRKVTGRRVRILFFANTAEGRMFQSENEIDQLALKHGFWAIREETDIAINREILNANPGKVTPQSNVCIVSRGGLLECTDSLQ